MTKDIRDGGGVGGVVPSPRLSHGKRSRAERDGVP